MGQRPIWRSAYDVVERAVGPPIDRLLRSESFAVAVGLAQTVQRDVIRRTERISRRAWHMVNLPAGSDVNRLLTQMGSVERQVRELEKRLEDATDGSSGEVTRSGPPGRPNGGPRARPT
jgi:hypothetical protein